jgi:type III restriction enzyme
MKSPIINSPYFEPTLHFASNERGITEEILQYRRPSSYYIPVPRAGSLQERAQMQLSEGGWGSETEKENEFVNKIRAKIGDWRRNNYAGLTKTSRDLLYYWKDESRHRT